MAMKLYLSVTLIFFSFHLFSQSEDLVPTSASGSAIHHSSYSYSYSEEHEQAEWVFYELTSAEAQGSYGRTDDFRVDQSCTTGSAELDDYRGSGYDRGHLAPAGDMAFSETAMSESFFMTNMCPQDASFNRGIWRSLESQVRTWAIEEGSLLVITGPIFTDATESIGANQVTVPKYFYKIVLDLNEPEVKALAFILPNQKGSKQLDFYVVSIDSVETLTSIDFFPGLPDDQENELEKYTSTDLWEFKSMSSSSASHGTKQCRGGTKDGSRCKIKTSSSNQLCWLHEDQTDRAVERSESIEGGAPQCKGMTQDGDRCKRKTTNSSQLCWQHEKKTKSKPTPSTHKKSSSTSRCIATTQSGSRCKRKTTNSSGKCWQHE